MKKIFIKLKELVVHIVEQAKECGPFRHGEPIPVDPPVKPKEEEK